MTVWLTPWADYGDDYDCEDDGDDLYIIGAVCLSVYVSQKSLFLYSKDLVISPVSRHLSVFKEFGCFSCF